MSKFSMGYLRLHSKTVCENSPLYKRVTLCYTNTYNIT